MAKYDADTIPTCVTCDTRSETKVCLKCAVVYCRHYASTIDNRFCANCVGEITVKESILEKTIETIKPDGTVSFSRKYQSKMIKLEGVDWLFAHHLIEEMADSDIDAAVEYHRANVDLMLMEREARKQERMMKLASVRVVHSKNETQEEREKREAKELAKKNKKVTTKTKEPSTQDLFAALMTLAKSGMSQAQVMEIMQKGKKK